MVIPPRLWLAIALGLAALLLLVACADPAALAALDSNGPLDQSSTARSVVKPNDGVRGPVAQSIAVTPVDPVGPAVGQVLRVTATPAVATAAVPAMPPGLDKIKHFVFIMQENRSFDSYFGTYPGADGIPSNVCLPNPYGGPCVSPYHDANDVNRGGPHDLANGVADVNDGAMDGFLIQAYQGASKKEAEACLPARIKCAPGRDPRDVMGWHDYREIPNYWTYAHWFVLQDHMFSSVASYTLPNRLYALAAQSGGLMSRGQQAPDEFDFPVVTEVLADHGIDWKYYVTSATRTSATTGQVVNPAAAPNGSPDRFSVFNPLPAFGRIQNDPGQRARLVDTAQFYADARSGRLPQVCWIAPSEELSEHPPYSARAGMAYVTGLVNAVMEGPDWESAAVFISYDEWGGFYDHVAPPRVDGAGFGIRVPGLVISPYARAGYVDHQVYSPQSWLRIVEERYGLPPLTARDATAADMTAAFDFRQSPRPPLVLAATSQGSPYAYARPLPRLEPPSNVAKPPVLLPYGLQ